MSTRQGTPRPLVSSLIHTRPRNHTIPVATNSTLTTAYAVPPCAPLQPRANFTYPVKPITKPAKTAQVTIKPDPSFVCTICWQPQTPPSKPKLLGSSSRIVCHPCWRAVLDLSICWVCGECIVRGDDVISLGWCFWHRGCFGCLLCGVGLGDVRAFIGMDGQADDIECGGGRKGTELDKIPLCEWCEVETKDKGYGEKKVLERGLQNVSRFDGGLTRCRLEKLDEDRMGGANNVKGFGIGGLDGEEMLGDSADNVRNTAGRLTALKERKIRKLIQESSTPQEEFPLLHDAAAMGISEDGNPIEDEHSHSDNETADFGQDEPPNHTSVYVSIFDPAGRAFIPSKTKPLPKWMSLLPNNVNREREHQRKADIAESQGTYPDAYAGLEIDHTEDCPGDHDDATPCPSPHDTTPSPTRHPSGAGNMLRLPRNGSYSDTTGESTGLSTTADRATFDGRTVKIETRNRSNRPRSVSIEARDPRDHTLARPSYRRSRRSNTLEPASDKPRNYPWKDLHDRRPTPYPRPDPLGGSDATTPRKNSCCDLGSTLEVSSASAPPASTFESFPHPSKISKPSSSSSSILASSSEYLDRYNPILSILPKSYTISKEPEPIIEKIRKQKAGAVNVEDNGKETRGRMKRRETDSAVIGKGKEKAKFPDEEFGLDPRREDLKRELRNLFCEE